MPIDLKKELISLMETEGLGRLALLRRSTGTAPMSQGGEWDPEDPRYWDGRSYLDHEIMYYYTPTMMSQLKSVLGTMDVFDDIIFIAAKTSYPEPTTQDAIVPLQHDLDGNLITKVDDAGRTVYLIDETRGFIRINSVLPYWSDTNSQTVFYAISSTKIRTGWRGHA